MSDEGNSGSLSRRDKAAQTRRTIAAAAHRLFCERGYAGTRMADVARESGFAVQTVYFVFHSKPELLQACYVDAVKGQDDPRPPQEQPFYSAMLAAPTGEEFFRHFAEGNTAIQARIAGLADVVRAARHEPEANQVWEFNEELRRRGYAEILAVVEQRGWLRPGLDMAEALDLMLMYGSAGTYNSLVRDAGWDISRFTVWLGAVLARELLNG
ncbi:TetR/AcrR family transcriptional regulator [Granulicoccus phenolivorans]|uniref:TetR/AcrR family transcriptional regulator n=1 Tax=Granulicoccus phenolivorans TaxID=266854 RepID=UPI00041C7743|nr:TetR/AcrR family transcriptional regulator [Granulicoccus phenolivorans]